MRAPDHPVARALLAATGRPLAAPSANRSGRISPTQAAHVLADLGDTAAMILDGGATAHGLESTIVDARGDVPVLLRPGAVTVETIEAVLGQPVVRAADRSGSGRMRRASSPATMRRRRKLRLDARDVRDGEALLAFGAAVPPTTGPVIQSQRRGRSHGGGGQLVCRATRARCQRR